MLGFSATQRVSLRNSIHTQAGGTTIGTILNITLNTLNGQFTILVLFPS